MPCLRCLYEDHVDLTAASGSEMKGFAQQHLSLIAAILVALCASPLAALDATSPLAALDTKSALRSFVVSLPHRNTSATFSRLGKRRVFPLRAQDFREHPTIGVPVFGRAVRGPLVLDDGADDDPGERMRGAVVLALGARWNSTGSQLPAACRGGGGSAAASDGFVLGVAARAQVAGAVALLVEACPRGPVAAQLDRFAVVGTASIPVVLVSPAAVHLVVALLERWQRHHHSPRGRGAGQTPAVRMEWRVPQAHAPAWSMWSWSFVAPARPAAFAPARDGGEDTRDAIPACTPAALRTLETLAAALAGAGATFAPRFAVLSGARWGCGRGGVRCGEQCTNGGRFCALQLRERTAPSHFKSVSAAAVLRENLRQLCVLLISNKGAKRDWASRAASQWFAYTSRFSRMCGSAGAPDSSGFAGTWGRKCSADTLRAVNADAAGAAGHDFVQRIGACVRGAGGAEAGDKVNPLLQREVRDFAALQAGGRGAAAPAGAVDTVSPPALVINGWLYSGPIGCPEPVSMETCRLLRTLCAAFAPRGKVRAPEQCEERFWIMQREADVHRTELAGLRVTSKRGVPFVAPPAQHAHAAPRQHPAPKHQPPGAGKRGSATAYATVALVLGIAAYALGGLIGQVMQRYACAPGIPAAPRASLAAAHATTPHRRHPSPHCLHAHQLPSDCGRQRRRS